jgi:hypothetical protein
MTYTDALFLLTGIIIARWIGFLDFAVEMKMKSVRKKHLTKTSPIERVDIYHP